MFNKLAGFNQQKGFTLVEVLTVMLVLVAVASVTVQTASTLAFQGRDEITKDRYAKIRASILGNTKVLINGQQAVSGFVADMGRLPVNLRELIQFSSYCTDSTKFTQTDCENTAGAIWQGRKSYGFCNLSYPNETQCLANAGSWIHLFYGGWSGPYLNVSGNPADNNAFTDGWGTTSDNLVYGWRYEQGLNPAMLGDANPANDQTDPDGFVRLVVQSFGRDQIANNGLPTNDYIDDSPPNILPNDAGVYYPNPLVDKEDWLMDISGGIKTHIKLPSSDTRQIPPVSFCTDPTKTTKANCTSPIVWFGGCEDQTYYNKSSCEAASKTWHSCSDESSTDKVSCETAGAVWYGEGFGCEDQTKTSKTDCTTAGKPWRSCTDNGTITTQSACTAAKQLWYGESFNGGCSDIHYTNKASCEAATKTWHVCSIVGLTTFQDCKAAGGYWLGNGYGCSDQQYSNQAACESNSKVWLESWPRCYTTSAPNTELLVPYYNIKTGKDDCEGIGGSWKYPRKQLCINVFYRQNGNLNVATSFPALIEEDGAYQTLQFLLPAPFYVPAGQNAIGIYEYDGDCDPVNNPLYPLDRQNPIQVDFHPHATLPTINW